MENTNTNTDLKETNNHKPKEQDLKSLISKVDNRVKTKVSEFV